MKQTLLIISIFISTILFGQNPKGFDKMVKGYLQETVTLVHPEDCKSENVVFLDARELEEYNVSHIENAVFVGYDNFDISKLIKIDKKSKIVVYCSIGYRSEKIGEQLLKHGFTDVNNLYGGIFNWSNNGNQVYTNDASTNEVHGYSKSWSKWLNEDKVTVVTGKKK